MKKSIVGSLKAEKVKYLFVSRGPGETGQARALAKYLAKKGEKIIFCLREEKNLAFLKGDKEFKIFLTKNPQELKKVVVKEKPTVLLIFNSKMWGGYKGFLAKPPFQKPPFALTVDSNWLFNEKEYPNHPPIRWVDKYLLVFPKKIFELGLKEKGGNFKISPKMLKKIIPVGFIPSYEKISLKTRLKIRKKYKIATDEKFIFAYFSGFGAGHRVWAFDNLVGAVDRLVKKGYKIKTSYIGPREDLNPKKQKRNWLIFKDRLSADEYFQTLASSDLIFQHQGLVTLAQGISAQVPIIANVALLKGEEKFLKLHFWEVRPFAKAGACLLLSKSTTSKKISQKIEQLLYNSKIRQKMQGNQKAVFEKGEEKTFAVIKKLIKAR